MKIKDYTDGALVNWGWASGWNAVYASKELGGLVETRPIIGWAMVAVMEPGRKSPVSEVHGILSVIGDEVIIAGWERSFLGYERVGVDARVRFAKAAGGTGHEE